MAVELRSVGVSPGSTTASCIIVKPAGLAVDDLMIAHVSSVASGDPVIATTPPGGWTEIRQDEGGATKRNRGALFWKIADAADAAASAFTFTTDTSGNLGAISAWTGHDTSTPINAHNGQHNNISRTITSPAITPSVANCVICLFCSAYNDYSVGSYAIVTSDPGLDEAYDITTTEGLDTVLAMAEEIRTETTSTGNGTALLPYGEDEENVGQLVAIAPEAVGIPVQSFIHMQRMRRQG